MLSSSPTLFAANHVLHRLLPPRHPPSALSSLTIILVSLGMSIRLLAKSVEVSRLQHRLISRMQDALSSERYSVIKDRRIRRSRARLCGAGAPRSVRFKSSRGGVRRKKSGTWWSWTGSNRRPQACKARALPAELQPPADPKGRASASGPLPPPTCGGGPR